MIRLVGTSPSIKVKMFFQFVAILSTATIHSLFAFALTEANLKIAVKKVYKFDKAIKIRYNIPNVDGTNYVAIYKKASAVEWGTEAFWMSLCDKGDQNSWPCDPPAAKGNVLFSVKDPYSNGGDGTNWPPPKGNYKACLLNRNEADDEITQLKCKSFIVQGAKGETWKKASVEATKGKFDEGEAITLRFRIKKNTDAATNQFVGLYKSDRPTVPSDADPITWVYIGCNNQEGNQSQTKYCSIKKKNGSVSIIDSALKGGKYFACLIFDNNKPYKRIKCSKRIKIMPTTPPTGAPAVSPTSAPTGGPTSVPTTAPTGDPVVPPTGAPPTASPTSMPTSSPTSSPTVSPTGKPPTHIDLVDTLPDAEGYALVYDLDPIPTRPDFSGGVAYTRAELDHPAFSRVAYFVELEGDDCGHQWAWVSVDAFTDNVALTGVPCPVCGQGALQQSLTNLNVVSNVPGLNGTSLAGNMEFWPFNYDPFNSVGVPNASDDVYDSGDSPVSNPSGIGYGSMQIHAENPSDPSNNPRNTVFAFNRFNRGQIADLGIGTRLTGNPDWTTAKNTDAYALRRLRVYVQARGSAPPTVSPVSSPPATSSPVSSMTTVVTLGASGVDTVVPSGACPATVTKELVIDGSAYTDAVVAKAPATLLLYRCASVGFDPMKIQLIGFQEGLWFEIVKVGTKVNLVVKSLTDYAEYFRGAGYSGDYPFQVAQGHYPDFHWDTVPKWISYRKKPNRADSRFTPDEIRSIANTNYMSWFGLVSVDEIVEVAAAIKVANPDYKQLLYWNSFSYWGAPISTFNENWLKYKVVNGQRWYLTMKNNKYVYRKDTTNKRRYYNHAIPAMRQWWIDHAVMMTNKSSIDGVFCDATRSNMDTDHSNMIEQLMHTLPEDTIKMGNFLRQRDSYRYDEDGKPVPHNGNRWRMPYADGSYLENVHDGPVNQPKGQSLIASLQLAREALWKGKIIFWNGAPYNCLDSCEVTEEEMAEYIKPTLAEYLILAEEYSYFNFAVTPVATDNPAWMWNTGAMEEFQRPLGRPLGPPVKVGNTFTRHFEHVAVMLTVGDDGVNKGTYVGAEWT